MSNNCCIPTKDNPDFPEFQKPFNIIPSDCSGCADSWITDNAFGAMQPEVINPKHVVTSKLSRQEFIQ